MPSRGNQWVLTLEKAEAPEELEKIREAIESLTDQVTQVNPEIVVIERSVKLLQVALLGGLRWVGDKADLAVDTGIKWAVPAVGGGYIAMNPDKVSLVIEAAKVWLNLLP